MNIESDDYCIADYGVFGNLSCNCSICRPIPQVSDLKRNAEAERWRKKQDRERETSQAFNSHMIHLYNARNP